MIPNLKTVIVDDEPSARAMVRGLIQKNFANLIISGEAAGVEEAKQLISKVKPDILFLDVEMEDGTGFDLLDKLEHLHFNVIFTTAHDDFAIKAFRYNAIDYLLKPIDPDEFVMAVDKTMQYRHHEFSKDQLLGLLKTAKDKEFTRITLSTSNGHVFTNTVDIIRIETYGNYSFVYLIEGDRLLVSRNLKEFEEMLPEPDFFRLHQSHIVNTNFVKKVIKEDGDQVVMMDGIKIPLSRRRKEDFMAIVLRNKQ